MSKITLITGADKGMGLELAKELGQKGQYILLGSRNLDRGKAAAEKLLNVGVQADCVKLDVTDAETIQEVADFIQDEFGYLDILINNAGVALDNHQMPSVMPTKTMRQDFDVNFFGVVDVTQAMLPLLKKSKSAKIINISSEMGSLNMASDPNSSFYKPNAIGYQASKAANNMFTIDLSKELAGTNITVNAIDPGFVKTDFGNGKGGVLTPAEGVAETVKLASSKKNEINGQFLSTKGLVEW